VLLGNNPLFHVPQYELVHPAEFAIYAVLGVVGGLLSAAFTKLLLGMRTRFLLLPMKTRWWHPVTGGLLVGMMGWFVPQALGVGYGYVGDALNNHMALKLMALLVVLKLFGVTVSYASGNAGGIFGPALFLGAMLGGTVGSVAHHFFPASTALPGAYALVGMGALFAGIVRAPMTSVLMIFEMTHDYAVIVPLMIANLASLFISSRLQKQPIYEALAHQDGIHLPDLKSRSGFGQRKVFQAMRNATESLTAQLRVQQAVELIAESQFRAWPLIDEGNIVGVISRTRLMNAVDEGRSQETLLSLLDTIEFPHVHTDHALHVALERMSSAHIDILPVVNRANVHKLEGVVTLRDVLDSYGVDSIGSA
jgi:chloride channel protein, CIC family